MLVMVFYTLLFLEQCKLWESVQALPVELMLTGFLPPLEDLLSKAILYKFRPHSMV